MSKAQQKISDALEKRAQQETIYRDYYSAKMLADRYCVNASTIWRWVEQKKLPKPVQFSDNCTRWKGTDIQAAEVAMGVA